MGNESFRFKDIEILDWYDGVVRGIGSDEQSCFIISLVAWKIAERDRLYLILKLGEQSEKLIRNSFDSTRSKEANWKAFSHAYDKMIKHYEGPIYLARGELVAGKTFKAKLLDNPNYSDRIVPYDVQNAFQSDNITFWFNLI